MDATLLEQRGALKRQLADGEYKTLVDLVLDGVGRIAQQLTRSHRPISYWYSAAVISLLILLIGFSVSLLRREFFSPAAILVEIGAAVLAFASLIVFKVYIGIFLATLRDSILDALTCAENVADLKRWLALICHFRAHLAFILVYGLGLGANMTVALSVKERGFVGWGPTVTNALVGCVWGIPMYFLLVFLMLPLRLGKYEYQLYKADPSSSEVIDHLSGMLKGLVYLYAVVAAGSMLFFGLTQMLPSLALGAVLVAWLPITALFALNQYALARIITRAKWRTLNEIQAQVEKQVEGNLTDKETIDSINRLMDYHNRIKNTPSSTLDLRATLSLLNSLLLPILGFLLGNLDSLKKMFIR